MTARLHIVIILDLVVSSWGCRLLCCLLQLFILSTKFLELSFSFRILRDGGWPGRLPICVVVRRRSCFGRCHCFPFLGGAKSDRLFGHSLPHT